MNCDPIENGALNSFTHLFQAGMRSRVSDQNSLDLNIKFPNRSDFITVFQTLFYSFLSAVLK